MSKSDIIIEVQKMLKDLKSITVNLDHNVSILKNFLDTEEFIPEELGNSIRDQLQEITEKQAEITSMYEKLNGQKTTMRYSVIEEDLSAIQKALEENKQYITAIEFFLDLHSENEKTERVLQDRKDTINLEKVNSLEDDELREYAEPYKWLQQAFMEKEPGKKFSLMYKLMPHFEEEIVAGINFDTLFLAKYSEILEEKNPEIEEKKELEEESSDDKVDTEETGTEELRELFVVENTSLLQVQTSSKAKNKFGVKEFKKDITKQFPKAKVECLIEALEECGYSVKSIAEKYNDKAGFYKLATEKLYQSGYLMRYVVDGMGEFFTLSPRGERVFSTKDARSFINLHTGKNLSIKEDQEHIEDTANSAIVRLLSFDTVLKQRQLVPEYKFIYRMNVLGNDYFINQYPNNDESENSTFFAGVITEHKEELQKFRGELLESLNKGDLLIVSGNSIVQAKQVAEWLSSSREMDLVGIYYTAYFERDIYDLETGLPVEIKKNKYALKSEIKVGSDESETIIQDEEAIQVNEVEQPEEETGEPVELNEVEQPEEKTEESTELDKVEQSEEETEEPVELDDVKESDELLEKKAVTVATVLTDDEKKKYIANYQKMIISGKIYAASAYLKILSGKYSVFEPHYHQLAYAVNDPMENCTYSSDTIFSIFYGDTTAPVSDYYIVSAALRNYFFDQYSYDYSLQQLYSMLSSNPLLKENQNLEKVIYDLMEFKNQQHKGVDHYADYREKERGSWEKRLAEIQREAKGYYDTYKNGTLKESTSHKRFIETTKLLLGSDSDLCQYLGAVAEDDREMLEMLQEFLAATYVKDQAVLCVENIDPTKIDAVLDYYWDQATENMYCVKKTSDLMSSLRMNLYKKVYKIVSVLCNYVSVMNSSFSKADDQSLHAYKKIRTPLLNNIRDIVKTLSEKKSTELQECAGKEVLLQTLKELESRLSGEYTEGAYRFYYIDFLKNDKVLLDEEYLPILDEVLELPDFSVMSRILMHCEEEESEFTDRMDDIFAGGDDYGSAELILKYLENQGNVLSDDECRKYNIQEAIKYPLEDLENKRKGFIEDIELAQSYGQIDNTVENSKETILQIMEAWYEWAGETRNFGFFAKILDEFRKKIKQDAQDRAVDLQKSLDVYIKENKNWEKDELISKAVKQIEERIKQQNYAAAEDLLNRVLTQDLDLEISVTQEDYLEEFLNEYDANYRLTAKSGVTLSSLINTSKSNKDIKGGNKLLESWPKCPGVGERTLKKLLSTLGFDLESVQCEEPVLGKIENYTVMLKRSKNGRKSNYKHPIAAFGSEAEEKGFRVVCIWGKTDASRLIDTFKEVGNAKNTLVLLDYALSIADRRTLARKTKTDISGKTFAVVDRVVLVYLAKHYTETAVNRMLMSVIMPYASYQPYIHKSADVMPPEIFIGRKYELEKIESATGVNIVYGGRQLGKSALLRMARTDIDHNENGDRAILVDIKGNDYKEAARKISAELYDKGILKEQHITEDWNELARDIKKRLNSTTDNIPYFLLLMDEADAFIESCEAVEYRPFDALKDIQSIGTGRFKFVVAGLRNIVRFKRDVALRNNSVLTHLDSLTVKPFKSMEARELLEVPLSYLGFRFGVDNDTEILISTIFGTTNYFPGLLQLYCTKLIEAMQRDYAGYSENDTPPYVVKKDHIKKVLAEQSLQQDIRQKFFITLKVGDDDYYYIIALLVAYHYHQDKFQNGCSADDLLELAHSYSVSKISALNNENLTALMEEMCELNVLRHTGDGRYRFARHSFCQMMGTVQQIDDELLKYMED